MAIMLLCVTCDSSFNVDPYRQSTAKFCSRECQGVSKRHRIETECLRCWQPYFYPESQRKDKYCSAECRNGPEYIIDEQTGCWNWARARNEKGYGLIPHAYPSKKKSLAHRVIYTRLVGTIPIGLVLDHRCENTACVNPDHLEPVTNQVNIIRGPRIRNARAATNCRNGHEWTESNTYINPRSGSRVCRICTLTSQISYKKRKAHNYERSTTA